ncbi:MAG: adenylate/guanylate cyclase domain-containing protein [Deltaproteobacteria bacterium]|nr:adenylate/guanylate cyclase domain-containing protein [Deltaproteobacteria bacterium]
MGTLIKKTFSVSPLKITILAIFLSLTMYITNVPFFHFMELKALDLNFMARGTRAPGGETVIAAIDEKSLTELGRWPWKRTTIALLVDKLKEYEAKSVGFDVVFAEPDENSSLKDLEGLSRKIDDMGLKDPVLLKFLDEKKEEADTDLILARSIRRAGNVTLGYFFYVSKKDAEHLSEEDIKRSAKYISGSKYDIVHMRGKLDEYAVINAYSAAPNVKPLNDAAARSGYFNSFSDIDGANRRSPLVIRFRDNFYPPLSVSVLKQYLDSPGLSLKIADYGVEGIKIGDIEIPTDEAGRILVNFLGPAKTFPHYSITDIIHNRLDPDLFKNKIVLIGATATGIYDLRVTPFSTAYPGVGIHATVIDNILHQNFIRRPGWTSLIDIFIIILVGFIMGIILSRAKAVSGFLLAIALIIVWALTNRFIFSSYNLWLNTVYPLFTILTVYIGITIYRYITEEREKKKIRGAFQYYLTASVITEMLKNPSKLKLGGDKKNLSVLFSDIRGFTTVSERLTPEELVHLLNEYLTAMTDIVFKYDGLLDKYMGDAIMAVFGAPLDQPDHPKRACMTAIRMMEELKKLQKKWSDEERPILDIGIGVNSGDMVVGNMGSEMRFDYTVMGDSVNLGSRLEGINKEYGTNIVISEFTYEKVKDTLLCRELDSVRVKGKALPVRIYELLGERKDSDKLSGFVSAFEEGLVNYRQYQWDEAISCFKKAIEIRSGDPPSELYIKRCDGLKENPPETGWDGVYTMTKK